MDAIKTLTAKKEAQIAEEESEAKQCLIQAEHHTARAKELRAELRGFREAVNAISADAKSGAEAEPKRDVSASSFAAPKKRGRSMSPHWREFLKRWALGETGVLNSHAISVLCAEVGASSDKKTHRSQMSLFVKKGYLFRVSDGMFKMTPLGRRVALDEAGVDNETPPEDQSGGVSGITGEASAPPIESRGARSIFG